MIVLFVFDVEVVVIICVVGNVIIENVCVNVFKVLELCDWRDIFVFKGVIGLLLGEEFYVIYWLGVELWYVILFF